MAAPTRASSALAKSIIALTRAGAKVGLSRRTQVSIPARISASSKRGALVGAGTVNSTIVESSAESVKGTIAIDPKLAVNVKARWRGGAFAAPWRRGSVRLNLAV